MIRHLLHVSHPRPPHRRRAAMGLLVLSATLLCPSPPAQAGKGVTVESVNDYKLLAPDGSADLPNSVANGTGFYNTIASTNFWTKALFYSNASVWDTDFVDPQKTGSASDNDTWNFDRTNDALAYFTGHGIDQAGGGSCTSSAQCNSPPPGVSGNGFCRTAPPNKTSGFCVYSSPRALVTASSSDKRGHFIRYGNGQTALGEGYYGNISGAGTNGGVNLAVLDISHGVTAMFWHPELTPAFAGLHLLATIMPISGDTANMPNRGSTFANQYVANPNGSVALAWMETLNSLPQYGTWACGAQVWNDYTHGGGHGINGCGCNFIMSVDSSSYWSNWHINNENWTALSQDSDDANGLSWFTWMALCNYDLASYPWGL
jgi:hypothetical protein